MATDRSATEGFSTVVHVVVESSQGEGSLWSALMLAASETVPAAVGSNVTSNGKEPYGSRKSVWQVAVVAVNEQDAGALLHGAGAMDVNFPGPVKTNETVTWVAADGPEL
jgi:hypothetical protein